MTKSHEDLQQQLEQIEQQLTESAKFSTLGVLVAGVAHEINNPVCYVKANLQTLQQYIQHMDQLLEQTTGLVESDVDLKASVAELKQQFDYEFLHAELPLLLDETAEGIERIEDIVASLRSYAHVDENGGQWVDLNELIGTALKLAHHALKQNVQQINRDLAELPVIWCQPSQISQVLINVLVNAAQAMSLGGDIDIATRQLDHERVEVRVCDRGQGIAEELLSQLFDTFVTTKPSGQGTGLGLSVSQKIIVSHGGTIWAENRPKGGACFILQLPINPVHKHSESQ